MAGVNKVIILGNLGKDPELRQISNGSNVCNLTVATSEVWFDKDKQKQERTEWHKVVVWSKQAENCAKYLTKGSKVYVEGRIQTKEYTDKNGGKAYATEIMAETIQFLSTNNKQEVF